MEETWKNIDGHEGRYQVSNLGRVKTLERTVSFGRSYRVIKEKVLTPSIGTTGYFEIKPCKEGRHETRKIHRLVANAFIDNIYNKPQVNHIDGNKLNNKVENLEWVTKSENAIHAYKTGLVVRPQGELNRRSILRESQVIEIKDKISKGGKVSDLCVEYNVNSSTVASIKSGKSWRHIKTQFDDLAKKINGNERLNKTQVNEIRCKITNGNNVREIANEYKVSGNTIRRIKNKETYT